jgi:hypothetical protein
MLQGNVVDLLFGLTKSSGDNEISRSLIYPESCVLDELKESLRGHSCAILSFGSGACPYETSLKVTASIAQKLKRQDSSVRCERDTGCVARAAESLRAMVASADDVMSAWRMPDDACNCAFAQTACIVSVWPAPRTPNGQPIDTSFRTCGVQLARDGRGCENAGGPDRCAVLVGRRWASTHGVIVLHRTPCLSRMTRDRRALT